MKKATFGFNINDIAEIAILCSLAIVLDQLKFLLGQLEVQSIFQCYHYTSLL